MTLGTRKAQRQSHLRRFIDCLGQSCGFGCGIREFAVGRDLLYGRERLTGEPMFWHNCAVPQFAEWAVWILNDSKSGWMRINMSSLARV